MHVMQNSSEFCFLLYYIYSDAPFHAHSEYHLFSPQNPFPHRENLKILRRPAKLEILSFSKKYKSTVNFLSIPYKNFLVSF
jgi:hypothetical protein